MTHPLQQRIVALRRRVRRMAMLHGLSVVAVVLLAAMIAMGLIDYAVRFQDRGMRIIASLLVLGAFARSFYRWVGAAMVMRLGDVELALCVERRFPHLEDRLVSAVDFLRASEDDPAAGSAALRHAVVARAAVETERLDFSEALDSRPMFRAVGALVAACLAVGIVVVLDPAASRTAAARLLNPLSDVAWPRTTHLVVRRPVERVARGQAFAIEVVDAQDARLPPEVRIHYRFAGHDGVAVEETERMRYVDGAMAARRENVLRSFAYRVEGGDDQSMPWRDVQVVEPPAIKSVAVRLIPPAYTGWPPVVGERHIRALVGTKAEITGRTTKPLRSVILHVDGGTKTAAQLSGDGCLFTVAFLVEKSGSYWFDLTDREGLGGGSDDRWEIHAVADSPPTVNIEQPTANLFVTPGAVAPLRVVAQDDLALQSIALVFRRAETEPEETQTLWTSVGGLRSNPFSKENDAADVDRRTVDYAWNLGSLGLKPGMQVSFHATAADYLPRTGKSEPRSLTIIAPDELQDRIVEREKLLLAELDRALRLERGCRVQIESIMARLAKPPIEQAEIDQLQAAAHNQREADQLLTSRGEGVPMHIHALLTELENNRVPNAELRGRLAKLLAEIDRLQREHLPVIGHELTAAVKTAQVEMEGQGRGAESQRQVAASLATVAKGQDAVIASITELIGQMARWDSHRRFARAMGQLLREQEDVAVRTAEVGRRTLTQELRDLTSQDVANLKDLANRQLELARLLDRVLQEMDQADGELRQSDPSAARTVADALGQARRVGLGGQMRNVGQQIPRNQIGQAASGQKQIVRDLREVIDMLAARQTDDSGTSAASQADSTASPSPTDTARPKPGTSDTERPGTQPAAAGSSRAKGDGKVQRPDRAEIRAMMKQLWGELPEHARQRMLQLPVEEFSPKYESLIEDYFRRLAEEKGNAER